MTYFVSLINVEYFIFIFYYFVSDFREYIKNIYHSCWLELIMATFLLITWTPYSLSFSHFVDWIFMGKILSLAVFILLLTWQTAASSSSLSDSYFNRRVIELDNDNFLQHTRKLSLVTFYSRTACPQCLALKSPINSVAEDMYGQLTFGSVDIKDPHASDIITRLGLTSTASVPAVRIFPSEAARSGKIPFEKDEGDPVKLPSSSSQFTSKLFKDAIANTIAKLAKIETVTGSSLKRFLKDNHGMAKALLVTSKRETPLLWQAMAVHFDKRVSFGIGQKSDRALLRKLGGIEPPAVLVFPVPVVGKHEDVEPIQLTGPTKAPLIKAFLAPYALDLPGIQEPVRSRSLSHSYYRWFTYICL